MQYLSGKAVSGGIAWVGVLCSGDFGSGGNHYGGGYAVTQVYGTYPLQMWDQFATAHETGHNAGSPHTHCYSPAIDHCYASEPGCYAGPVQNPGAGGGTIMSYCHLLGWQYVTLRVPRALHHRDDAPRDQLGGVPDAGVDVPRRAAVAPVLQLRRDDRRRGNHRRMRRRVLLPGRAGHAGADGRLPPQGEERSGLHSARRDGPIFGDVPANAFGAAWIEQLANLGVTGGCGGGNYCPSATVTRKQMATFLLKTKLGSSHVPPGASGVFADVPMADSFAPWIEELYGMTVTGGCLTNPLRYCPDGPNTRGQMAVFLVKTFAAVGKRAGFLAHRDGASGLLPVLAISVIPSAARDPFRSHAAARKGVPRRYAPRDDKRATLPCSAFSTGAESPASSREETCARDASASD